MNPKPIHGNQIFRIPVGGQMKNIVAVRTNRSVELFGAYQLVEERNAKHGTHLTVASKKVAEAALPNGALDVGGVWMHLPAFPVDAVLAHEKPGKELGRQIVFSAPDKRRVILPTGEYEGAPPNSALLASGLSSSNVKADGKDIFLDLPRPHILQTLVLVPDFPATDGYYEPHAKTGIPHGKQIEARAPGSKHLSRLADSSYVGPLVFNGKIDFVVLSTTATYTPSDKVGIVAEVPDGDVAKINEIINRPLLLSEQVRRTASVVWKAVEKWTGWREEFPS